MIERIGGDVKRELSRFGPAAGMAHLVDAWPAAVGEAIARNAWPARLDRQGTLRVATSSAAWAFELGLLESDIANRLGEALGETAPKRLRFAPGPLPTSAPEEAATPDSQPLAPSAGERVRGEQLAAQISDPNLRELVAKAAAASLARASSGRAV